MLQMTYGYIPRSARKVKTPGKISAHDNRETEHLIIASIVLQKS